MKLIKSLRSFGRWMFNIKDEVKVGDIFENREFKNTIYVISVNRVLISYRFDGSLIERSIRPNEFHKRYRKIS